MDEIINLSFIIPCHNLEDYIKPLLLSFQALNLNNLNVEFIFILDKCTDNTESIIKYHMIGFDTIILHCEHGSCGLARNEGMAVARGTYIWFVDGDDWIIYPNVLQDTIPVLDKENLPFIRLAWVSNFFTMNWKGTVWQHIYRYSFIKDIPFLSIQPDEDKIFNEQVLKKMDDDTISTYNVPSYYYNYRRPGSNMTKHKEKQAQQKQQQKQQITISSI